MSVTDLGDARDWLRITSGESDAKLQQTLDAAENLIAKKIGLTTLTATPVTTRVTVGAGRGDAFRLPVTPVISITSIGTVIGGSGYLVAATALDGAGGLVTIADGSSFTPGVYDVTYEAGFAELPPDLAYAVRELTKHMWESQRGNMGRGNQKPADAPGYLIPNRVAEVLDEYVDVDGFA